MRIVASAFSPTPKQSCRVDFNTVREGPRRMFPADTSATDRACPDRLESIALEAAVALNKQSINMTARRSEIIYLYISFIVL